MISSAYLGQIIKNKQYILLFIFVLCSCITHAMTLDTVGIYPHTDSVQIVTAKEEANPDTINFNYIFLDRNPKMVKENPIQDSLLRIIEIEYTDLQAWFNKMDKLKKTRNLSPILEKENRPGWLIGALLFILTCLGVVRVFFYSTFLNVIYGFFNERVLGQISKEDNVLTSWPYILLYLIFSLSLGLFVLIYFGGRDDLKLLSIENFARLSLIIGVLFVAKLLLIRIISIIFEAERIARNYITVLYVVYFNSMLYLIPILIFAIFLPFKYLDYLMIILVVGVVMMFSYRIIRTGLNLLGNLKFSIFYLILYLCALEIAPILILVKSLNN